MRVVVTGATGNTGAPLVRHLSQKDNINEIIAISRDPSSPSSLSLLSFSKKVKVVKMENAFDEKVDRAFMVFANTPDQFVQETDFLIKCKDNGINN